MQRLIAMLTILLLGSGIVLADGMTAEDLKALHEAGVAPEVIVAKVESDGMEKALSTDEIIDLTKSGIDKTVIVAALDHVSKAAPATKATAPAPQPEPQQAAPRIEEGVLILKNRTRRRIYVTVDAGTILISASTGSETLPAEADLRTRVSPGDVTLQWADDLSRSTRAVVNPSHETVAFLFEPAGEPLRIAVYRDGTLDSSTRIAVAQPAPAPAPIIQPAPQTTVVKYVNTYTPTRTIVYRSSRDWCDTPRYYRPNPVVTTAVGAVLGYHLYRATHRHRSHGHSGWNFRIGWGFPSHRVRRCR